jgi:hypothetical protein
MLRKRVRTLILLIALATMTLGIGGCRKVDTAEIGGPKEQTLPVVGSDASPLPTPGGDTSPLPTPGTNSSPLQP